MYHIEPIWDARSSLCLAATIVAMLVLIGISVIMYNIFLHPASKFPGPTIAGATSLRYHWAMSTGNVAPWLREQHARYGEIVRIAPDMISYVNPDAWRDIYAYKPGKKEQNGIDWTIPSRDDDVPSMFSEANDAEHNRVRRLFLPAFSDRALKQQEPLLSKYSDQLIDLIRRGIDDNSNQEFDAVKLYNFTTFDIMGDLTFGEPLGLLKNSSYTEWVQNLFHDIKTVGIFLFIFDFPPLPWLVRKFSPPSIQRAHEIHKRHTVERVNRRLERGLDRPDIWNLVLSQPEGRGLTRAQMHANADIFMIAGTETTATLLSGLTYLLLKNPEKLQKLVKEIRGSFGSSEELTVENLARLPYLSACLSEGLRCYPPVPIGPSRLTPMTGAEVLGEHIPGRILQAGYNVRVTLREMSQADAILSSGLVKEALSCGKLDISFVHVPDFTAPDAFGSVLSNVTQIVHVATQNCPSVRRVVITSSTSAIVDPHPAVNQSPTGRCITPSDRHVDYDAEYYRGNSHKAYTAAKTAALNATDAFLAAAGGGGGTSPLHFDVINIMPSFVFGPKGLAASPADIINGSNIFGIGTVMRHNSWKGIRLEAVCCHVDDVAQIHVNALDERGLLPLKPGTHRDFILGVKFKPEDIRQVVKSRFPIEFWENESAVFGAHGTYEWYHIDYDVRPAEGLLGKPFKTLGEQIYDSGSQVLGISKGLMTKA
ncbi:unnamed protein product [Fusarium fujikuroi]|nr:unnamed protein product [Fusarium fujikuroi]